MDFDTAIRTPASPASSDFLAHLDWGAHVPHLLSREFAAEQTGWFHTVWVTHGANIRSSIDDDVTVVKLLRKLLPPYQGNEVRLYRGESWARYAATKIGLCWTPQRNTAEMFASGLQAFYPGGGVLLSGVFPAASIISAEGEHSRWLGEDEYTVDASMFPELEVLKTFPKPG